MQTGSQVGTQYEPPPIPGGTVRERAQALGQEISGLGKAVTVLEAQLQPVTRSVVPDAPRDQRDLRPASVVAEVRRSPQCDVAQVLDSACLELRMVVDRVNRLIDRLEV